MASKLFLDYFLAHSMYLSSKVSLLCDQEKVTCYETPNGEDISLKDNLSSASHALGEPLAIEEESAHLRILKDSLLRTIQDIEKTLLKEAYIKNKLSAGTTAIVALLAHGQILVANLGDSKAFLFSERMSSLNSTKGTLLAKEMTQHHYLTRKDESFRFDSADDDFSWGTYFNHVISAKKARAIGHFDFKIKGHYSLTTDPEVTDWLPLTTTDTYLILQTRKVSWKLKTPQDVCNLLPSRDSTVPEVQCRSEESLAECIALSVVNKYLTPSPCPPEEFSEVSSYMCNYYDDLEESVGKDLSVIVVPLVSSGFLRNPSI